MAREGALVISFQNGVSNVDVLEQSSATGSRSRAAWSRTMSPISATAGSTKASPAISMPSDRAGDPRACRSRSATGPAALKLSDDMLGLAWGKLLINLNNAVNALSGRTCSRS